VNDCDTEMPSQTLFSAGQAYTHEADHRKDVVETFVDLCAEQSMGVRRATMNKWPKTRSAKFEAKKLKGEGLLAGPFTSARSSHNSTHSYLIQLAVNI